MSKKSENTARSLGESINVATRSVHTKLNKLILSRLPLVVPPQANDPSNYVSGLLHITPIYSTFESLWQNILSQPVTTKNGYRLHGHSCEGCKPSAASQVTPSTGPAPHQEMSCSRIYSLLRHVHMPELERVESLKQDIMLMTGWSPDLLEEQILSATDSPILFTFLENISRSVKDRPHVLLAYAWVLYMALFSGGRFIKASMSRVEMDFWKANIMTPDPGKGVDMPPLNFFTFNGPGDGDGIKLEFKKRLGDSEPLLTDRERGDVVAEAQHIFESMVEIVGELDSVCSTDPQTEELQAEGIVWRMSRLLGLRARDSE
jgi:heme oxygenase